MCGINGIVAYRDNAPCINQDELLGVRDSMLHRGPDGAGLWTDTTSKIGLAHRRLAIIDLSESGNQPMSSIDGRYRIVFNGEIYNYRELRSRLESKGYKFKTNTDTEVILYMFAAHGTGMLQQLRGMFAIAIWDEKKQTLFLARDAFGIKPLYYADDGETLRFASQVKALLQGENIDTRPDPAGSVGFLLWGHIPEPFTLYQGIHSLPAGNYALLKNNKKLEIVCWFNIREELIHAQEKSRAFSDKDQAELADILQDAVRYHLVSDVPVGIFLSAGLDSSLITALASKLDSTALHTHTLGFNEYKGTPSDEVPLAEQTASACNTNHQTHWVNQSDFTDEMDNILAAMDQPTIDGINMFMVCREAKRKGLKVALSGVGGDELFRGYPGFKDIPKSVRFLHPMKHIAVAGKLFRNVVSPFTGTNISPKYAGLFEYGSSYEGAYLLRRSLFMPWEINKVLDPVTVYAGLERLKTLPMVADSIRGIWQANTKVMAMELSWYMRNQLLRDADWAGMAHSLEVRTPLVDITLFRKLAPWLVHESAPGKVNLFETVKSKLSNNIIERPKSGFSVPVKDWLEKTDDKKSLSERGLRGWAKKVLPPQKTMFRVLILATDAYGGRGGIAKFNGNLFQSISTIPACAEAVIIPRISNKIDCRIPENIKIIQTGSESKPGFVMTAIHSAMNGPYNLIIAGHINYAALCIFIAWFKKAKSALIIHGIDAWTPHGNWLVRLMLPVLNRVIGVSNVTLERFGQWSRLEQNKFRLLPNSVDMAQFTPGEKPGGLVTKLDLKDKKIMITIARLAQDERYKGIDEVIDVLPELVTEYPALVYLVCGDGTDRVRLESKVQDLGLSKHVIFAGYISDSEKVDYYRLADAFVMPGYGEGFGIVYLEALACGLPVLASELDGSREALMNGAMGVLVNPKNKQELISGLKEILRRNKEVPEQLEYFSYSNFRKRSSKLIDELVLQE